MRQFTAFLSKESMEALRTGKALLTLILFTLFGIMNPAVAKLTPWMMEVMSESLEETGLTVTAVEINAMTSWTQFYKNIPMALIIFLLLFSTTLTGEYQKGTLINITTKGMTHWKIVLAKLVMLTALWTLSYWLCYGITCAYTMYFWDNGIAFHLGFSAFCYYLMGLWLITVVILVSTICRANSMVLLATGGSFLISYLLGLLPRIADYVPTRLGNTSGLLTNVEEISSYTAPLGITMLLIAGNIFLAIFCFNKRGL